MADITPLDDAQARMERSDADRLRFFAALADAELFLLLESEPEGEDITPQLFAVEDGEVVLAFDTEARLAEFADGVAPYAALPGRILAQLLSGQGIGLGLNLDVAPSSTVLPPDALQWLTETLGGDGPDEHQARFSSLLSPGKVPDILLEALGARLSASAGLADRALLAMAQLSDGAKVHVLAIVGASERAEAAMARAVSEALTFSGVEAGYMDVVFLPDGHELVKRFSRVGLRFDIPRPEAPSQEILSPPGSDPSKPPILK